MYLSIFLGLITNKHLKTETEFLTFSVGKWRPRGDLSVRRPSTPGLQKMFTGILFFFHFRFQFIFSKSHTKLRWRKWSVNPQQVLIFRVSFCFLL